MKQVYAVHQASTLCGENQTELFSNPIDAGARYAELVAEYIDRGDDIQILTNEGTDFFADNESQGIYNSISIETLILIS